MLIEFCVKNFRSIKEEVIFSMEAANIRSRDDRLNKNNVFEINKTKLLKSAAIYGANASGKSNLLAAMRFMKYFVLTSATESQVDDPIETKFFALSTETLDQPSGFEIIFLINKTQYRYGYEVDRERVTKEWLYYVPTTRETLLFSRELNKFEVKGGFKEGKGLEIKTRKNALFLSVAAQFNGEISTEIFRWFKKLNGISGIEDFTHSNYTTERLEKDKDFRNKLVDFVQKMDIGIQNLSVQESRKIFTNEFVIMKRVDENKAEELAFPQSKDIFAIHKVFDQNNSPTEIAEFDIDNAESEGTRKLIYMLGPIFSTLEDGEVLLIDEFDARFHPLITMTLIKLFNSNKTNPNNAQLIFATHDTNLLSNKLFRRDQIWFTEKNRYGATDLYSLAEVNVRNDASFEKDYIKGKYGAIPYLGNLDFNDDCEE